MEKRVTRIRQKLGSVGSAVVLGIMILIAIALIVNRDRLTMDALSRAWNYRSLGTAQQAEEFLFQDYFSNTFALLGDSIAVASVSGLRVYDRTGAMAHREIFSMERPVIESSGPRALAYDLGGIGIAVSSTRETLWHTAWSGAIIDARINENDWLVISAERMGTRGVVTVLNPDFHPVYEVRIGTGYLIGATLAPDNRTLAILTMTDGGGQILWYHTDYAGEYPYSRYLREDTLFFDFWFTAGGNLMAISSNGIVSLTTAGTVAFEYPFADQYLRAYARQDAGAAFYLTPHPNSMEGTLVHLPPNGRARGIEVQGELLDISLNERYLVALFFDRLVLYRDGREYAIWDGTEGMTRVLSKNDGSVLRFSTHRARLLVP
ncbi:MAG: DUF5711 family protein [Oscillospiraceae bacterium]|nr:DUF5711 family protein [Oscillospiraceae bacterium]